MICIKKWVQSHLKVPTRSSMMVAMYLIYLMIDKGRRTLTGAAKFSEKSTGSVSEFLSGSLKVVELELQRIASETAKTITRSPLVSKAPWTIGILIDATLHKRSTVHTSNSQKHNHGKGFVIGHQWTNIVILINGHTIPLPPIPFYTKKHCIKNGLQYKSEHDRIIETLMSLDLKEIVGDYRDNEVVVICDSGYDNRDLFQCIMMRGWDVLSSMKSSSTATVLDGKKQLKYGALSELFCGTSTIWKTVYAFNGTRSKRKDFRASAKCILLNRLDGVEMMLVCSEPRRDAKSRRKYLVCSNIDVDLAILVRTYRLRWEVELFHKSAKSNLGMEDLAAQSFDSVHAHVLLVYIAFILLQIRAKKHGVTIAQEQDSIRKSFEIKPLIKIQKMTREFGAVKSIQRYCAAHLQRNEAA